MISDFWKSLTTSQRTIVIFIVAFAVIGLVGFVLGTIAFLGTDYSGLGSWVQGWFQ